MRPNTSVTGPTSDPFRATVERPAAPSSISAIKSHPRSSCYPATVPTVQQNLSLNGSIFQYMLCRPPLDPKRDATTTRIISPTAMPVRNTDSPRPTFRRTHGCNRSATCQYRKNRFRYKRLFQIMLVKPPVSYKDISGEVFSGRLREYRFFEKRRHPKTFIVFSDTYCGILFEAG